jgi:hypothetical protein
MLGIPSGLTVDSHTTSSVSRNLSIRRGGRGVVFMDRMVRALGNYARPTQGGNASGKTT